MQDKEHLALSRTIKRGIVLYCMLALIAVPSGICSYQHRLPDFELPALEWDLSVYDDSPGHYPADPQDPSADNMSEAGSSIDVEDPGVFPLFHEHILQAAQDYDVDPALIMAIIQAESNYNPRAVSKRGAQGLMQLMPTTARALGIGDSFDPALNIDGGVRYFRQLLDCFGGDVALALAAYNAGSRYVRKYKGVPPFRATKFYINKVLKYWDQFGKEIASLKILESAS